MIDFKSAQFCAAYGTKEQLPPCDKPEFAFVGRSNVGKSSMLNALFGRKSLARVSNTPGKTGTVNFYSAGDVYLVDLPGYGFAKQPQNERRRYASLVSGYFESRAESLEVVFLLIDFRHKPTKDDLNSINFFITTEIPFVIVLTKADKLSKNETEANRVMFREQMSLLEIEPDAVKVVEFSAINGLGLNELRHIITQLSTGEKEKSDE
ncbi:MAG: ribosome biogenesis GTP-binding protein YihA/YsxC [Oscillospiraceae bacterium]|nr:ribosome biogenesis GTP-binding protein YihA/YsxC [Oscillospiraceae bacterium]